MMQQNILFCFILDGLRGVKRGDTILNGLKMKQKGYFVSL